ncbi:DUF2851 family protein [Bizionia gelidisalsuginis]|uniref:DUF2851 family protein n=2 Tax=Bizionia TaxID=283785 RepID=A0A8H2QEN6_9FLAO|nr:MULTISPECIES: DUF2851 family protein [Bizionia]TYB74536.1 DUF2851 family protein [Bizionia saleffrena]TYC16328.1 DUF2851 family protein [Bizionia gelidisalsuginis]
MQEDFLHYIWKHKKFQTDALLTSNKQPVLLSAVGEHNLNSGPDFFNAKLQIGGQLWAGNVEIHIKSSDWYVHHHETDSNYDNVILHVVWEHDAEIFRKNNTAIPTLELKHYVSTDAVAAYKAIFNTTQQWINCEKELGSVSSFVVDNWLERLYIERLERKANAVTEVLKHNKNNWEAVLFKLLCKNFGLKVNGDAFNSLANSIDFSVLRKQQSKVLSLEALLFGQAQLLDGDCQDPYFLELTKEYAFLKQKFALKTQSVVALQFFRLRPPNFPTIRLSQLAQVYFKNQNVFSKVIEAKTLKEFYDLFSVETSNYWESHYTFNKASKKVKKKVTKAFIDLLLINTIIPLKFSYSKYTGQPIEEELLSLIGCISAEKNTIVKTFRSLNLDAKSALESQAVLQLKTEYCDKNRCLQCAVGNTLLNASI